MTYEYSMTCRRLCFLASTFDVPVCCCLRLASELRSPLSSVGMSRRACVQAREAMPGSSSPATGAFGRDLRQRALLASARRPDNQPGT